MSLKILVDENLSRLFSPKWERVRRELESWGYQLVEMPSYLRGASDEEIVRHVIGNRYDGLITEDRDFVETHRSKLYWKLINNGKVLLTIRRVNPNSTRGMVIVFRYNKYGKTELFRLVIDY